MSAGIGIKQTVKTRFCPSPTGLLHLGNLRTALFNVLFAKKCAGQFLLRIEDTDRERSNEHYTECLQRDLMWLELPWQEGPGCDGGHGPYYQSQRQIIYDDYYQQLQTLGSAYPCFCTEQELVLARKLQRMAGKPPRYPGTCRHLNDEQIAEKLQEGKRPTLRFRVPENEIIEFFDLVRGVQQFRRDDIGDFIIRRADGSPPFLFCNAIDDALMEVSHVIRGEDHVANTPRQILILQALQLPIPHYGHIALIVGSDGSPLSKRHGSRSAVELREQGYLPISINNYLARLGHYYGHDQLMTLEELAAEFRTENLSKAPAKFNAQQLDYWQKIAVDALSEAELKEWLGEQIVDRIPVAQWQEFIGAVRPNISFPQQAQQWAEILFQPLQVDETLLVEIQSAPTYFAQALLAFDLHGADIKAILNYIKEHLQLKGKALFQPLRLALTGEMHGPELDRLGALIHADEIKRRLQQAAQFEKTGSHHVKNLQ